MAEDLDLFFTPRLQYLGLKRNFLNKFMVRKAWGEFGSKEQLFAVSGLLDYFQKTKNLAEEFPQLINEVILDNKKLVLDHILPIPPKLYEQLLLAVVGGGDKPWLQPASVVQSKIEEFLVKQKAACLAYYEDKVWLEVHTFENYTSDRQETDDVTDHEQEIESLEQDKEVTKRKLAKLRSKIYAKIRSRQSVTKPMKKYKSLSEDFIQKFEAELSGQEVEVIKNRLDRTENSVRNSKLDLKSHHSLKLKPFWKNTAPDEEIPVGDKTEGNNHHEAETQTGFNCLETKKEVAKDIKNITQMTQQPVNIPIKELLVLPDVPSDTAEDVVKASDSDIDDEIQKRLTRLKLFSMVWCQPLVTSNAPSVQSATSDSVETEIATSDIVPAVKEEPLPVVSTESDRQDFNEWYYSKISQNGLATSVACQDLDTTRVGMAMVTTKEDKNIATFGGKQELLVTTREKYINSGNTATVETLEMISSSPNESTEVMSADSETKDIVETVSNLKAVTENSCKSCMNSVEGITLLQSQLDEVYTAVQVYQYYLIGLVTMCSYFSNNLDQLDTSFTSPPLSQPSCPTPTPRTSTVPASRPEVPKAVSRVRGYLVESAEMQEILITKKSCEGNLVVANMCPFV